MSQLAPVCGALLRQEGKKRATSSWPDTCLGFRPGRSFEAQSRSLTIDLAVGHFGLLNCYKRIA
jgi:hypothetical protein